MDDIDRPGEPQLSRSRSPIMEKNRPPVAVDESEELDEVDRPSATIAIATYVELDVVDLPAAGKPQQLSDSPMEEMLPSIVAVVTEQKLIEVAKAEEILQNSVTMDEEEEAEEMLPTINSAFVDTKFELIHTFETETTDSPAASSDSATTDGPLDIFTSTLFTKPHQPIQHRSERRDKEGIVTKHTTYHPKPLEKTTKGHSKVDATDAVPSDSFYDMSHFPRGKLTLINVKHFKRSSGMADYPREGTDRDAEGLTNLFLDLGFVVERFDNPSKSEIVAIVKAAAHEDYSSKSCCACAILSHGEEGIIYGTDDFVKIKDITKLFRSRTLAGKPKFFLFQACQGSEYMNPLDSVDGPGRLRSEQEMALTLPSEADFLYAYSTVPGFYSWRNSRRGSWFMEALVQVFRQNAHKMDVMRMLVRVNDVVAYRKSRTDDYKTDNKRQIASLVTQMRKDFFLCPPYGPLPHSK